MAQDGGNGANKLLSSYVESDSGFMDFTQAPNARKSTIFGGSLPPHDAGNSSLSALLNSHTSQASHARKSTPIALNEPGSSSSFSLLTSRFTDDKYITPSALGYEEYKELIASQRGVEEGLENVLGHDEHAYGGPLPSPTYNTKKPNGTIPPLSEFSPATSPSPYQNGGAHKYDYNGANGHNIDIPDTSSEEGFAELANGTHRLSENGYDSIAEFDVDELGDSEGEDDSEDIFVASEELERRRNKKARDNRTNGHNLGSSPLKYATGIDGDSSEGEEVVNYPPNSNLHDFVDEDHYEDEVRTSVLGNGGRDYNFYEEGSSVHRSGAEYSKISKKSESEDSSIPRFEDVIAPASQIAEPTFEDANFPDLDKDELVKQLDKDRKMNDTYEDEEANKTVELQEGVVGHGRDEVSVSPPPTIDNEFVDVTPGTFFRARSSFDMGYIASPATYTSPFNLHGVSTPQTPANLPLSARTSTASQLAKSHTPQSPAGSVLISPQAQPSPSPSSSPHKAITTPQKTTPPQSPPSTSPRHSYRLSSTSATPQASPQHQAIASPRHSTSSHSPRLSRTLSFTSNPPAAPSPSPPTSPTTPSTSTRTPPWDATRSVPTPLSESPKKEAEPPKKEVSVDVSRTTELELAQKLDAKKDNKKGGVWFDEETLAAHQEDRAHNTRNMSMMSVTNYSQINSVPQTPINYTPSKTQLDSPSLALLQAKFSRMFPDGDNDSSVVSDYSGAVKTTKSTTTVSQLIVEKTKTTEESNRSSSLGSDFDNFYNRISSTLENFRVPPTNPSASVPPTPYARPLAPPPAFTPSSTTASQKDNITPEGSSLNPPTFASPAATAVGPFSLPRSSPSPSQFLQPSHTSHSISSSSSRLSSAPTASRLSPALTASRLSPAPTDSSPLHFRSSFSDLPPFYAAIAKNATLTTSLLDNPPSAGQANFASRSGSALSSYTPATATPGLTSLVSPIVTPSSLFSIDPQYIDFGDLFQDWATDAPLALVNKSKRTLNLAVAVIGTDKESFSVSLEGQHGVSVFEIPGSSTVKLKVSYHPTLPGLHASSLQGFLLGEGGGGACFEARLRGTSAEPHGHPLVLPSSVDVGVCEVGERIARTVSQFHMLFLVEVTITNTGDAPLYAGLSVSGREFSVRPSALTVPARGAAELSLTFEPYKEKARHRAEICVEDTVRRQRKRFPVTAYAYAGDQPAAAAANFSSEYSDSFSSDDGLVARRKNGQGKGWIGVPQGVDLGVCALACRTTKALDVINYSSQPLTLYTSISPDIGVFSTQANLHLAPHAKGLLHVEYISTVPGSHTAMLQLTQKVTQLPQKGADDLSPVVLADLHLRGETEEHKFRAQPSTEIDFGVVSATSKSGRAYKQPVKIHNPGEASIKLDCHISATEPHYWGLSPEKDTFPTHTSSPIPLDISPNSSHVLWTWFVPQKRSSSIGGSSSRRGSSGDERYREEVRDHRATLHISPHVDIGLSDSYMQLHTTNTRTGAVVVQIPKWAQPLRLVPRTPVSLPIRNAGSIPLTLAISFEYNVRSANHSQVATSCFQTNVSSITLPVGGVEKIDIAFVPTGNTTQVATLLLRGGGILHTIQVVGQTKPNPSLLCTHPVVNFGGVQIGSEVVRQFTLRNPTPHNMTLNVATAHTDNFRYTGPAALQLAGNADVELAVVYSPKSKLPHRAVLFFEEDFRKSSNQHPAHFQLPLLGYGGESNVVFNTTEIRVSSNGTAHITAKNEGNRAAFIRAACEDSGVEIAPFGVVVGAGRTQNFNITVSGALQTTSVQFYFGDEILRKKRRECKIKLQQQLELQPKKPLTHSQYGNPAPDIFDETFIRDADYVNEDILSQLEHKEGSRRFDDYFDCELFLESIKHHYVTLTPPSPHVGNISRTKSPSKHTPTHRTPHNHSNDSHNRTSYSHAYVQGKHSQSHQPASPHHVRFPASQSSSSIIIRTPEVTFPPISGSGTTVKSCLVENPSDFVQHWKLVPLSDVTVTSLDLKNVFSGPDYDTDVFHVPTPMSWTSPHTQSKIEILFSPPKSGCTYTQVFGLLALNGLEAGTRIMPDIIVRGSALYANGSGNTSLNSNESYDAKGTNSSNNKTTDTVKHTLQTPQTEPAPHTAYPRTHSPHRARTHSPPKRHHAHSKHPTHHVQQQSSDSDDNNQRFDKYIQEITKSLPQSTTTVPPSNSKSHHTSHHFITTTKSTVVKKSGEKKAVVHQQAHQPHIPTPSSSSPKPSQGLYIKDGQLKFPTTAMHSSMKEKICICNGSQEDLEVVIESLAPPFFCRYKHVPIQKLSYVRLPIVFFPTEKGKFRATLRVAVKQDTNNPTTTHVSPSSAEVTIEGEA